MTRREILKHSEVTTGGLFMASPLRIRHNTNEFTFDPLSVFQLGEQLIQKQYK